MAHALWAAPDERVTLEKPISVMFEVRKDLHAHGQVIAYDRLGFDILGDNDRRTHVTWAELDARGYTTFGRRLSRRVMPANFCNSAGICCFWMADASGPSGRLIGLSSLDPNLKDQIERAEHDAAPPPTTQPADNATAFRIRSYSMRPRFPRRPWFPLRPSGRGQSSASRNRRT